MNASDAVNNGFFSKLIHIVVVLILISLINPTSKSEHLTRQQYLNFYSMYFESSDFNKVLEDLVFLFQF